MGNLLIRNVRRLLYPGAVGKLINDELDTAPRAGEGERIQSQRQRLIAYQRTLTVPVDLNGDVADANLIAAVKDD